VSAPDPVTAYARRVAAGRVLACQWHRLACARHLRDLARQKTAAFPFYLDRAEAALKIAFFAKLTHGKGEWAGQPIHLEPWQQFIIGSLFGWKRVADKARRFRVGYVEVPRGSGKSVMTAGIGLLLAFFDDEPGSEVYACATKREQAKIVFDYARRMVLASPGLRSRIWPGRWTLVREATASKFQPLGADANTTDGLRPHGGLIDELHAHKTGDLVGVIETGMGTRRQPLLFEITTAGTSVESICYQHHDYVCKVLAQVFDDETWFGFITTIDEGDDWQDERSWQKANPNYAISVKPADLKSKCETAAHMPAAQADFKRKHLNIWTEAHQVWIPPEAWAACPGPLPSSIRPIAVAAGLDLSSKLDLTAFVVARKYRGPRTTDRPVTIPVADEDPEVTRPAQALTVDFEVEFIPFFWMPEATLQERVRTDHVRYDLWLESGHLRATPGNVVDYDQIFREIVEDIGPRFVLKDGQIGFDAYNATQFTLQLHAAGYTCVEVPQTVRMLSEPAKLLQALVVSQRVRHDDNRVMRWCMANVAVREDKKGNIYPFKPAATKRIDGAVAAIIALSRLIMLSDEEPSEAARDFEARGLFL
jgi:phage terminase large subunit-like protein